QPLINAPLVKQRFPASITIKRHFSKSSPAFFCQGKGLNGSVAIVCSDSLILPFLEFAIFLRQLGHRLKLEYLFLVVSNTCSNYLPQSEQVQYLSPLGGSVKSMSGFKIFLTRGVEFLFA